MTDTISPHDLRRRLTEADELALLDVREQGVFARAHILLASNLPLSRLETDMAGLVPRRTTPIVLCDDDDGLAERAARRLSDFGYENLTILDGGLPAWRDAGRSVEMPSAIWSRDWRKTQ